MEQAAQLLTLLLTDVSVIYTSVLVGTTGLILEEVDDEVVNFSCLME